MSRRAPSANHRLDSLRVEQEASAVYTAANILTRMRVLRTFVLRPGMIVRVSAAMRGLHAEILASLRRNAESGQLRTTLGVERFTESVTQLVLRTRRELLALRSDDEMRTITGRMLTVYLNTRESIHKRLFTGAACIPADAPTPLPVAALAEPVPAPPVQKDPAPLPVPAPPALPAPTLVEVPVARDAFVALLRAADTAPGGLTRERLEALLAPMTNALRTITTRGLSSADRRTTQSVIASTETALKAFGRYATQADAQAHLLATEDVCAQYETLITNVLEKMPPQFPVEQRKQIEDVLTFGGQPAFTLVPAEDLEPMPQSENAAHNGAAAAVPVQGIVPQPDGQEERALGPENETVDSEAAAAELAPPTDPETRADMLGMVEDDAPVIDVPIAARETHPPVEDAVAIADAPDVDAPAFPASISAVEEASSETAASQPEPQPVADTQNAEAVVPSDPDASITNQQPANDPASPATDVDAAPEQRPSTHVEAVLFSDAHAETPFGEQELRAAMARMRSEIGYTLWEKLGTAHAPRSCEHCRERWIPFYAHAAAKLAAAAEQATPAAFPPTAARLPEILADALRAWHGVFLRALADAQHDPHGALAVWDVLFSLDQILHVMSTKYAKEYPALGPATGRSLALTITRKLQTLQFHAEGHRFPASTHALIQSCSDAICGAILRSTDNADEQLHTNADTLPAARPVDRAAFVRSLQELQRIHLAAIGERAVAQVLEGASGLTVAVPEFARVAALLRLLPPQITLQAHVQELAWELDRTMEECVYDAFNSAPTEEAWEQYRRAVASTYHRAFHGCNGPSACAPKPAVVYPFELRMWELDYIHRQDRAFPSLDAPLGVTVTEQVDHPFNFDLIPPDGVLAIDALTQTLPALRAQIADRADHGALAHELDALEATLRAAHEASICPTLRELLEHAGLSNSSERALERWGEHLLGDTCLDVVRALAPHDAAPGITAQDIHTMGGLFKQLLRTWRRVLTDFLAMRRPFATLLPQLQEQLRIMVQTLGENDAQRLFGIESSTLSDALETALAAAVATRWTPAAVADAVEQSVYTVDRFERALVETLVRPDALPPDATELECTRILRYRERGHAPAIAAKFLNDSLYGGHAARTETFVRETLAALDAAQEAERAADPAPEQPAPEQRAPDAPPGARDDDAIAVAEQLFDEVSAENDLLRRRLGDTETQRLDALRALVDAQRAAAEATARLDTFREEVARDRSRRDQDEKFFYEVWESYDQAFKKNAELAARIAELERRPLVPVEVQEQLDALSGLLLTNEAAPEAGAEPQKQLEHITRAVRELHATSERNHATMTKLAERFRTSEDARAALEQERDNLTRQNALILDALAGDRDEQLKRMRIELSRARDNLAKVLSRQTPAQAPVPAAPVIRDTDGVRATGAAVLQRTNEIAEKIAQALTEYTDALATIHQTLHAHEACVADARAALSDAVPEVHAAMQFFTQRTAAGGPSYLTAKTKERDPEARAHLDSLTARETAAQERVRASASAAITTIEPLLETLRRIRRQYDVAAAQLKTLLEILPPSATAAPTEALRIACEEVKKSELRCTMNAETRRTLDATVLELQRDVDAPPAYSPALEESIRFVRKHLETTA